MKFVFPAFLFALFALAIPVIIHLFSFRRFKKVYFSNVRFLKEVKKETQSKSRLRHLLVLASRILAISFLVFAFAQPYLPVENKTLNTGNNAVSIFIDNSFSMDAISKNGRLLDEAKKKASEITAAYHNTDRFQVLTNDFEGKHLQFVSKEELQGMIDAVKISPRTKTLKNILSIQSDLLNNSKSSNKSAYIISDFQKSSYVQQGIKNDTAVNVFMIPVEAQQKSNVYIDSCWFASPVQQVDQVQRLNVRIINRSEKKIENSAVKLYLNNQQKAVAAFNAEVDDHAIVALSFTIQEPGIQHGKIEISDYPITFDDQFYFSIDLAESISILAIHASENKNPADPDGSSYLHALYGKDSLFVFNSLREDKLDYSLFSKYNILILDELKNISSGLSQELKRFISNGGSLLVFPGEEIDLRSYQEFLGSVRANHYESFDTNNVKVDKINYESELFKHVFEADQQRKAGLNIDLPVAYSHYRISRNSRSGEEYILKLLNGDVFLGKYEFGKGKIYLSAVSLNTNNSNFAKHALFVPVMYQAAIYSQPMQKLFYIIGNDEPVETDLPGLTGEQVVHIKNTGGDPDIIPEFRVIDGRNYLFVHDQVQESGHYNITSNDRLLGGIAFNYNRTESDPDCFSAEEVGRQIEAGGFHNIKVMGTEEKSLTQTLSELNEGKKLWKLCVIFALAFLGMEVLLLRFWK